MSPHTFSISLAYSLSFCSASLNQAFSLEHHYFFLFFPLLRSSEVFQSTHTLISLINENLASPEKLSLMKSADCILPHLWLSIYLYSFIVCCLFNAQICDIFNVTVTYFSVPYTQLKLILWYFLITWLIISHLDFPFALPCKTLG